MIAPLLTRLRARQSEHLIPMERFYEHVGLSRQGYFQALARHERQEQMMVDIKLQIKGYRKGKDSRAGSRSMYYNLGIKQAHKLGVNKFERLVSAYGLSLKPLRIRVVTTRSAKRSWNYSDLSKGLTVSGINEVVVGDLTYVNYGSERYYLFCLTEVYSARIVGWSWSTRMRAEDALVALMMWKQLRGPRAIRGCIHHTDGGSQYFSDLYLGVMGDLKLKISVARNCLDNGFAEQRNGLLKHHLLPVLPADLVGPSLTQEVSRIIDNYNHERKQEKLGWRSPEEYESHWKGRADRPKMKMYDREQKERTHRFGF